MNDRERQILEFLADTMSFIQTLEQFPGLKIDELRFMLKKHLVEPLQKGSAGYELGTTADGKPIELNVYIDGASSGNPGDAAFGVVVCNDRNEILTEFSQYIGKNTSNVAEYKALVFALHLAKDFKATKLTIFSDSELVVRQIKGIYKVKSPQLYELYEQAIRMIHKVPQFSINEIPRTSNERADHLATGAIKIHKAKTGKVKHQADQEFNEIVE
jgi:ribonuclease HI